MKADDDTIPEELQALNLTPRQLQGVRAYFALQHRFAKQQLHMVAGLAVIVVASLTVAAMASDVGKTMPFESIAEIAMQYVTLAGIGLGVLGVAMFEVLAHLARRSVGRTLELTPRQEAGVRDMGDGIVRYVLFGWVARLGRKAEK